MNFQNAFAFLAALKSNNNKAWFDGNRKWYEDVKAEWYIVVGQLIKSIADFDPEIGLLEPKNCAFRINRDIRFSKDKSPYKSNIGAYFAKGGKQSKFGGYYVHIDPVECFLAAGVWQPERAELQAIRQEIDYHSAEFKAIVMSKTFTDSVGQLGGEKLSSIPKGFEKENPSSEYLKHKSFVASKTFAPDQLGNLEFVKTVSQIFRAAKPLNDFLNKAVE